MGEVGWNWRGHLGYFVGFGFDKEIIMWVVDYINDTIYKAQDWMFNSFHIQKMRYELIYKTDGVYKESFHETELNALLALRKYHVDSSLKHLKRESELSKRIKELTTE
jgi:hypothetical protein